MDESGIGAAPRLRMSYLDNFRSLVILLVVFMHSNVTYSGLGGWYYKEGSSGALDAASLLAFGFYGSFTQAWFMGALFFAAAYFAARSLAKRGSAAFMRERLFRLGVPLLIYMLAIEPFIGYFLTNYGGVRGSMGALEAWLRYLRSFMWIGATGPLWFVEALLGFSAIYALRRAIRPTLARASPGKLSPAPGALTMGLVIGATGLAAFAVRLFMPIGTSVLNLQFCYFASYVALFLLGIHAGERNWLDIFLEKRGLRWLAWTTAIGVPAWALVMIAAGALRGSSAFTGGLNWQSFAYSFWEAFVAIGFSLGLLAFFKRFLNRENRLTRLLADNNFGVYMFHAPVLIGVSLLLRHWSAPMMAKHLVVAPAAYLLTLALSAGVLKRIPGLKSILK
jgi:glucans biosynthesis protein C